MNDQGQRIGHDEREAAVADLRVHAGAGRLDPTEYEDRSGRARQARTWDDLTALFTDLPEPRPAPGRPRPPDRPVAVPASSPAPLPASSPDPGSPAASRPPERTGGLVPEPWATWVMSLSPPVALILFFVTGQWWWFLAVPIVGLLVYGPNGHPGHWSDAHWKHRGR